MTDAERFAMRLKGARIALGLEQAELEERFDKEGYAKRMVGQLERAGIETIRGIHRAAASKTLGFPEAWFTSDDPRSLLAETEAVRSTEEILVRLAKKGVYLTSTAPPEDDDRKDRRRGRDFRRRDDDEDQAESA